VAPDIVYMDEPLGALDSLTRLQLRAEIHRLWKQEGMTILFVTHDVEEALQLADRIVVMEPRPGRIKEIVPVTLPQPRTSATPGWAELEERLYRLLGVRA
jgi:sulfonate transport system ATP-binding protein